MIQLSPERSAALDIAKDKLLAATQKAVEATELSAIKIALNRVWFEVHDLYTLVNTLDAETRAEALKHIDGAAA